MVAGQIALQGFECSLHDGHANKIVDGVATDEQMPLKILDFKDQQSGLSVRLIFTPEQFEQFRAQLGGSKIVHANMLPKLPFFTRNGGIKR